jgi:hypothetical protein
VKPSLAGLCLLLLLATTTTASAASKRAPARMSVRCADDTLRIFTGDGERVAIPLSAFGNPDTINTPTEARVWLAGPGDTLEIPLRPGHHLVRVLGARDTLRLWVSHQPLRLGAEHVALIRRFDRFGGRDARVPKIAYAPPTDSALAALRARYGLDAIAGTGPEFERIRNLMHWVHVTVRHDGTKPNPAAMDSRSLLEACDGGRASCNCRGLATVLNEVYLAMGIPSRHLTCLPYDRKDPDCHVVNMVWSSELGKWLYMDPTHDAWFADAGGSPLSPREIREAMRRGDPMTLPAAPNWNGRPVTETFYRNYMTKNFFRFSTPAESRYGYEQFADPVVELHLDPQGFQPEKRRGGAIAVSKQLRELHTADADAFWAPPGR